MLLLIVCAAPWAGAEEKTSDYFQSHAVFVDLDGCGDPRAEEFCKFLAVDYRPWTQEERRRVREALDPVSSAPKLSVLISDFKKNGIKEIVFLRVYDDQDSAGSLVVNDRLFIYLRNQFFTSKSMYGTWSEQSHALAHEFFHAYAHFNAPQSYFSDPFWTSLAAATSWGYPMKTNANIVKSELNAKVRERVSLCKSGKFQEAAALDLEYSRPKGFPSLYSMTQLGEYFAELGSFLAHDEDMASALKPDVRAWLQEHQLGSLL